MLYLSANYSPMRILNANPLLVLPVLVPSISSRVRKIYFAQRTVRSLLRLALWWLDVNIVTTMNEHKACTGSLFWRTTLQPPQLLEALSLPYFLFSVLSVPYIYTLFDRAPA